VLQNSLSPIFLDFWRGKRKKSQGLVNQQKPKEDLLMGVSTVSLIIVLFLLVMVLAMQFQIRQINRKMDELLKRKR
jgi:hypothetical protein